MSLLHRALTRALALLLLASGLALGLAATSASATEEPQSSVASPDTRGIDPAAPTDAIITGFVNGPSGHAVDNVQVEAFSSADPLAAPVASALTYAGGGRNHGYYALRVPAGSYVVRFSSPEHSFRLFSTRYHGGGAGTPVVLQAAGAASLPDVTMVDAPEVDVTGRVLGPDGTAVRYAFVRLVRATDGGGEVMVDSAQTDDRGRYTFDNAVRGRTMSVLADPAYGMGGSGLVRTWLGDAPTLADATSFVVADGQSSYAAADITLPRGAFITGRVTDGTSAVTPFGASVLTRAADGSWESLAYDWGWPGPPSGTTEPGSFKLGPIWPGIEATVRFDTGGRFATAHLGGAAQPGSARSVTTVSGSTHDTGVTALTRTSATVGGRVLDAASRPVSDASVRVYQRVNHDGRTYWSLDQTLDTDDQGLYRTDLPWGHAYTVSASSDGVTRFLGGAGSRIEAEDLWVETGTTSTTIGDIGLPVPSWSTVTGQLRYTDGTAAAHVQVLLFKRATPGDDWQQVFDRFVSTGSDGRYRIPRLTPGTSYTIAANVFMGTGRTTYLGGVDTLAAASPLDLPVEAGVNNAPDLTILPPLEQAGGVIAGR